MGPAPIKNVPCAKGALCYCLDEFSKGPGARSRIERLRDAIAALAPTFAGLTEVFDRYLMAHVIADAEERQRLAANLDAFWLDSRSPRPFFPKQPVREILAKGILETLDLSLKGEKRAVPINAWWVLDSAELRVLNLADIKEGVTVGGNVTLLIMTSRPKGRGGAAPPILGDLAEAYVTERQGRAVTTRRVRDLA